MLDWDNLRFFLAVARHRTLAGAAKQLHVTQSTVSRRLTALQEDMGVRLLQRTSDGYVVTVAGDRIREHVELVEEHAMAVERVVAGQDIRLEGVVRVASAQLLANHLLAPSFAALHALHSNILIQALPELEGESLANNVADIVVRMRRFEHPDLVVRSIGSIAFGLYASLAYLSRHGEPDVGNGCAGHQLITLLDKESAQSAWMIEQAGRARVVLMADSYETQRWSASCGGGLAVLPRFRADQDPALQRIGTPAPAPAAQVWLGVHRENRAVPRVRTVLDLVAETVRARAALLNPAGDGPDNANHAAV